MHSTNTLLSFAAEPLQLVLCSNFIKLAQRRCRANTFVFTVKADKEERDVGAELWQWLVIFTRQNHLSPMFVMTDGLLLLSKHYPLSRGV